MKQQHITRGRINVTENGISLEPVESFQVELNGWYYLGASSSPKLVKVVKAEADRFWYQDYTSLAHNEGQPVQIERWIGEDLISTGNKTMRKNVTQWFADDPETLADRLYILDKHDLSEESKQDLDLAQAEHEVCNTAESRNRRRTMGYEIEDAIREYCKAHRDDTDYWPVEDHNAYPRDNHTVVSKQVVHYVDVPHDLSLDTTETQRIENALAYLHQVWQRPNLTGRYTLLGVFKNKYGQVLIGIQTNDSKHSFYEVVGRDDTLFSHGYVDTRDYPRLLEYDAVWTSLNCDSDDAVWTSLNEPEQPEPAPYREPLYCWNCGRDTGEARTDENQEGVCPSCRIYTCDSE